jgi:hypothetical protein
VIAEAPRPEIAAPPAPARPPDETASGPWVVGALLAFALVIGAYFSFRFGGRWSEVDTAVQAIAIRAMLDERSLISPNGLGYGNGYAFSAVSTFLIAFVGLEPSTLLQSLYPIISAFLIVMAWPLYRELTGSGRGATIGTLILFSQPEFLFVILRGSHERVLRMLLFASLFLLARSFRNAERVRMYGAYVFLFYLCVYGVIATNSLFGTSYIWGLGVALTGSWVAGFFGPRLRVVSQQTSRRLLYVPLLCFVLAFVFNGYIYPLAGGGVSQIPDIIERLSRLLLTTSTESSPEAVQAYNPYAAVTEQWIDVKVYFGLSIATFALMLGSAIVWARMGLRWLAGAAERPALGQWLLWLFYLGFALQGALSVVADRAGMLGGNLQHRSFPSFVMVAAPLAAVWLAEWRPKPSMRRLATGALGVLSLLAVAKATNEPSLSNRWTFYLPYETAVLTFVDRFASDAKVWSDVDERLRTAHLISRPASVIFYGGPLDRANRLTIFTDVARLRSARLNRPMPPVAGELRVYDNGEAQVYRSRALTPFQD